MDDKKVFLLGQKKDFDTLDATGILTIEQILQELDRAREMNDPSREQKLLEKLRQVSQVRNYFD